MKGKVENTIPQRQFENIKTTYYFENEEERRTAIEMSIMDCINYSHIVPIKVNAKKYPFEVKPGQQVDTQVIDGITHYRNPVTGVYMRGVEEK